MLNPPCSEDAPGPARVSRRLWVCYHYLYPDNVVSAVLMDHLCEYFQHRTWEVTGCPSNRGCRDESEMYPARGSHQGVQLRRIWRPRFRQSSAAGRLCNALWMIAAWSLLALRSRPPDVIVIGTDPSLSVLTAILWKLLRPGTRIVHWCFDLYPEAAYADGLISADGRVARLLAPLLKWAYRCCDAIVDIGPCMREQLAKYGSPARKETIVPWALEEPAKVLPQALNERKAIAGSANLAMLYSGSFGRAHTFDGFLELAQALRSRSAVLAFSVRGNREVELRAAVGSIQPGQSCEIRFVPFAPAEHLLDRLAAPDIHLLSLAPNWNGLVVPSKFFGALAVGRPVLFSGSTESSIARWIAEYHIGWVLTSANIDEIAEDLLDYVRDPQRVELMQRRCFDTYRQQFSKASSLNHMARLLDDLAPPL